MQTQSPGDCSPHHLPATFCPSLWRMVSRTRARSRLSSLKVHRTSDGSHSVKGGCIPRGSPEHRKTLPLLLRMYRARVLRPCQNGAKSSPCGTTGGTSLLGCWEGLGGVGRSPNVTLRVRLVPSRNCVSSMDRLAFSCRSTLADGSLIFTYRPLTATLQ